MKLLILYATTDGQTRKIARFAADRLAERGHAVELLPAAEAGDVKLSRFDAAILAGSVHLGRYQKPLRRYLSENAKALKKLPTLFLSVSLAAASEDREDREGLDACLSRLVEDTGWKPGRVEQVAGAFRFSEYDFFRAWAMRRIAAERDETVDTTKNKEYTDWAALGRALDAWIKDPKG